MRVRYLESIALNGSVWLAGLACWFRTSALGGAMCRDREDPVGIYFVPGSAWRFIILKIKAVKPMGVKSTGVVQGKQA